VVGNRQQNGTENNVGLLVERTASLSNLSIADSAFARLTYGWYVFNTTTWMTDVFSAITVTQTAFDENTAKGTYIEKLSDATFSDVTANRNGDYLAFWNSRWNAGFDINLKYNAFQNLTFDNFTAISNALGTRDGAALMVKARDDGSYGTYPASLSNVTIDGATVVGNERGIRFGEPDKANAGPSNVTVRYSRILDNAKTYAGTDGTFYGGLINYSQSAVNGSDNWWGCNYGPGQGGAGCVGTTNGISGTGTITAADWLVLNLDADPAEVLPQVGTSDMTADVTQNQSGPSGGYMPGNIAVDFDADLGSVSPVFTYTVQGQAGSIFSAGASEGISTISTTVDCQTVTTTVVITVPQERLYLPYVVKNG
jgi:hypothetical protein